MHNHLTTIRSTPSSPDAALGAYLHAIREQQRQGPVLGPRDVRLSDLGRYDPACPECVAARKARHTEATAILTNLGMAHWIITPRA